MGRRAMLGNCCMGLLNQFVQLFNKCRRGEMRNIGEIEMMPVVGDDVITSRFLGTLVLQHILEVFYGGWLWLPSPLACQG